MLVQRGTRITGPIRRCTLGLRCVDKSNMAAEEELLRMSVTGEPPPSSTDAFSSAKAAGNAAFAAADYAAALTHYAEASRADPSSPIPHTNTALSLLRLDRPFDAAQSATTALALLAAHPHRPDTVLLTIKTLLRRAASRRATDQAALAAVDLREILALQPDHENATAQLRELGFSADPDVDQGRADSSNPSTQPRIEVIIPRLPNGINSTADLSTQPRANGGVLRRANGRPTPTADTAISASPGVAELVQRSAHTPPRDSSEFERTWRTLRGQQAMRLQYITNTVGATRLRRGVLGQTLTSELIIEVCAALRDGLGDDMEMASSAGRVLQALPSLPRFDLAVMFWNDSQKDTVRDAFRVLRGSGVQVADSLATSYGVA